MKNVMKKVGRTIVAFLPVPACFLLQLGVMLVVEIVLMFPTIMRAISGAVSYDEMMELTYGLVMENIMTIQLVAQTAMFAVFGLWYYLAYGRKKRPETAEKPAGLHIVLLVLMGLILQFGISSVLTLIELMAPKVMENYNELMETMGLGEMSLPVMIAVSVMAPLSEEVLCRGVILRLAEMVSPRFWVANVIQALAFGILHGNLVQGIYAFALGLVIGYIYGKYRNIWLCMLLHGAMNLSSYVITPFYMLFPEDNPVPVLIVVFVVSAALFVLCFRPFVARSRGGEGSSC